MLNDMKIRSGIIWRVLVVVAVLGAGIGLYACGGGGGTVANSLPSGGGSGGSGGGGGGGGGAIGGGIVPSGVITAIVADVTPGQVVVTSANTLITGSQITISGTTSYNGPFTVVSANATTFTIAATFVANDATGTWVGLGGVIASCATTGSTGAITLPNSGNLASRYTGVAPLAVFFNATGTTTTPATPRPIHDLEYQWTFGDGTAGNWSFGAHTLTGDTSYLKGKNRATGPVAAHVYEQPGTYIVSVTVKDATNTITNACMQISVLDPNVVFAGANTTCVNASGADHTGCPLIPGTYADSAACIAAGRCITQTDWPTIVNTLGTSKRILLRGNGDIYTGGANPSMAVTGPAMIGAYGAGVRPIIRTTAVAGNSSLMDFDGITSDLRLVDLDLDGLGNGSRVAMTTNGGVISQLTMLRVDIHDIGCGINFSIFQMNAIVNAIAFQDSAIRNLNSVGGVVCPIGLRFAAADAAIMGSLFSNSQSGVAEHLIRAEFLDRAVISNNTIRQVAGGKEMLTIRAPCSAAAPCVDAFFGAKGLAGDGAATKYVMVADNLIETNTYIGVQLSQVVPGDSTLMRDIVIERNYFQGKPGSGGGIRVIGNNVTVRNNIIDLTNGTTGDHMGIQTDGVTAGMAAPSGVSIYNNTIFSSDTGDFFGVLLLTGGTAHVVKNNLGFAPSSTTTRTMVSDFSTGTTGASGTLGNTQDGAQIVSGPTFTNGSTSFNRPADFLLTAGYAREGGSPVSIFSDFFGVTRPVGTIDIGATEQ